jgi:hypothetical protein
MCSATSDVRFGSKADVCVAKPHVRFTPESDRKSGHRQNAMSALPLKADCLLWANSGRRQYPAKCLELVNGDHHRMAKLSQCLREVAFAVHVLN